MILHQDNSAPVVSATLQFHVGSKDEDDGLKGFAHLFEHMLGKETKNMDSPHQKFVALYEINSPDVVKSPEWATAVEKGRWSEQVREHTSDRSHFMYKYI